jgi:hypothetical protein
MLTEDVEKIRKLFVLYHARGIKLVNQPTKFILHINQLGFVTKFEQPLTYIDEFSRIFFFLAN